MLFLFFYLFEEKNSSFLIFLFSRKKVAIYVNIRKGLRVDGVGSSRAAALKGAGKASEGVAIQPTHPLIEM